MKNKTKIFMEDVILVKNRVWFFSRYWNGLYTADLKSGETAFVAAMPEEGSMAGRLCAGIMYYNGKLILVPMAAKKIWVYDLRENSWKGLERTCLGDKASRMQMFRAVAYKNKFFLIGSNYPAIIRMDPDTYELEYWKEPYDFLISAKYEMESYFRADFALVGNRLFLASCLKPFVLCLNLDTFDFTWFKVGERDFRYSGIAWDGEFFWLSPRTRTPIVKWDGKDRAEYFPLPEGFEQEKYLFSGVQYDSGKLIFPGMLQNHTIIIHSGNPHNMEIQEGRYTFYRCFGMDGMLSQTADGLLRWRYPGRNGSGEMYCEIPSLDLEEHFRMRTGKTVHERFGDETLNEFPPSALSFYLLMLEQGAEVENGKLRIGEKIWGTVQN